MSLRDIEIHGELGLEDVRTKPALWTPELVMRTASRREHRDLWLVM
jgi:hypothetical protein